VPELLAGLLAQTYPRDRVEYLIVDNGSTDRTLELLQAFTTQEIHLKVLEEHDIQSSYAARNRGILNARSPYLAFTDADCRPEPDWLMNLIQPFIKNPELGWVAGEVKALESQNWLEQYADRQDTLSQKHTLANPFCPYGQTANLAVRRQCFEQIGGFRPHLTTGGDADLCWRVVRELKQAWAFAENAIVKHRHRSTLDELLKQWRRYGKSNRFLHDLHGIPLQSKPKWSYYTYRTARYFLKELPIALVQNNAFGRISTPIGLLCLNARWQGQQQAQLPAIAREIETIPPFTKPSDRETSPATLGSPIEASPLECATVNAETSLRNAQG
jgi:cellulose synthase/poly-beta-1,6-N-acetylglucosamine synthase-like glycosyltransferase